MLVAKCAPQFLDDAGDGRVGDKRVGPQTAMQFVFRDDSRRLFDEGGEQVERLAREVHTSAARLTMRRPASSANPWNRTTVGPLTAADYIGDSSCALAIPSNFP